VNSVGWDIPRLRRRLRVLWRKAKRGTTRAAAIAMCLLLCCAVVVGGSQVLPFIRAQAPPPEEPQETETDEAAVSTSVPAGRLLQPTDYNQNWRQVSTDWDHEGDVLRRHQVLLTPDGRLSGRVQTFADWRGASQPLSGAIVHLMRGGRVAARVETDAEGQFTAEGLSDGTYSLIAQSTEGLLAYALHVQTAASDAEAAMFQLESRAATAWDDAAIIARVLDYWEREPPFERTREPQSETIPVSVRPIAQQGAAATTLWHHRVRVQPDGRLIGRLRRLHPVTGRPIIARDIEVAIYRNGTLQGQGWTDETGYFEIPRVAPGVYSLVATGSLDEDPTMRYVPRDDRGLRHGFLTLGIEGLPANKGEIERVQHVAAAALELDAALVSLVDVAPFLGAAAPTSAPAGGMFAGTSAGAAAGGAAAGGATGLGGLLAAGAAGGLAGLAADDDTVSPARP